MCQNCASNNCTNTCAASCATPKVKMVYCVQQPSARYTVNIKKLDKCTRERIKGACIRITDQYGRSAEATTNKAGIVSFSVEKCTSYTITEVCPAPCYANSCEKFELAVDECGKMTLGGIPFNQATQFIVFENCKAGGCGNSQCCDCNDGMICYVIAEMAPVVNTGGCSCSCSCKSSCSSGCSSCSSCQSSCGCSRSCCC
ncbi:MAG: hypothetical protein FWG30_00515 [Eubacteriaceae bacterium]|nr:hypothetical protein [Eubacteriaceae bacterium]